MRYFRTTPAVYAQICAQLDEAYGYPNEATKTQRTLPLHKELPNDASGRVYLAVDNAYCEYILPSQMLPVLLAGGTVDELTESQYRVVVPAPQP